MEAHEELELLLQKWQQQLCTPAEQERLHAYLSDPHYKSHLDLILEKEWQVHQPSEKLSEEKSIAILHKILRKDPSTVDDSRPLSTPGFSASDKWVVWKIAASVVGLLVLASFVAYLMQNRSYHQYQAQKTPEKVQLPDGSIVMLNAHSTLIYEENFWHTRRLTRLKGEAFLQIARNPNKPFMLTIQNAEIEVVGTKFTVKENLHNRTLWVAVSEGKVACRSQTAQLILTRNQVGTLTSNGQWIQEIDSSGNERSWIPGHRIEFKNFPLTIVARQLERLYGIPIVLQDSSISTLKLTAYCRPGSLESILEKITISLNLTYTITPQQVLLRPASTSAD